MCKSPPARVAAVHSRLQSCRASFQIHPLQMPTCSFASENKQLTISNFLTLGAVQPQASSGRCQHLVNPLIPSAKAAKAVLRALQSPAGEWLIAALFAGVGKNQVRPPKSKSWAATLTPFVPPVAVTSSECTGCKASVVTEAERADVTERTSVKTTDTLDDANLVCYV